MFFRNKFNSMKQNEARFSGDGLISVDPTNFFTEGESSSISMRIKPESPMALLFFMKVEGTEQYLSLELLNGILSFKFSITGATIEMNTREALEMDRWYTVKLTRKDMVGELSLDGVPVAENGYAGEAGVLGTATHIFIGGVREDDRVQYPVVPTGYTGCISRVKILNDYVNLENLESNLEAVNVEPTCMVETKNTLSFLEGNPGYVKMPDIVTNGSITFSFQFRTGTTQGLLMYMTSSGMFYISLSMVEGALHLYAHPDNEIVTEDTKKIPIQFNDNNWHSVSVSIIQEPEYKIILTIDDFYVYDKSEVKNIPLVGSGTQYSVYYGGLPEALRPLMSRVSAHEGPFIGCIRDAIIINSHQNFRNAEAMTGASLGECGSADFVTIVPTESPPVVPTEQEEPAGEDFDPRDLFGNQDFGVTKVIGECKLPYVPSYDSELSAESGMRFGMKSDSFIEYVKKKLPEQMKEKSRFDMEFKTSQKNGILLFMKDDVRSDFFALIINDGKLIFSFDCGSGPSRLVTDFSVSDGQWHSVDISRVDNEGKLVVDNMEVKVPDLEQYSFSNTKILEVSPSLFLGGLDDTMKEDPDIKRKLGFSGFNQIPGFVGCLRKVRFEVTRGGNRKMRSLGKWSKNSHVIPCSEKVIKKITEIIFLSLRK